MRLFAKLEEDVTTAERQIGKKINFSIIYGLTPYGLSQDLGISLKAAKEYVEQYFLHYPGIKPWMEKVEHDAKRDGYVTTLMGRRRYVPGLQESNKNVYEAARRVAVNTVVQGTAADIIKLAMIHVADAIRLQNLPLKLLLQIHDELLFECLEGDVEAMKGFVVEQMEHAIDLAVPLKISVGVGKSWGDV
jgi:DNA polymerase-1